MAVAKILGSDAKGKVKPLKLFLSKESGPGILNPIIQLPEQLLQDMRNQILHEHLEES